MRVFVTGATGFVGSAVVRELIAAGHEVVGLARGDAAALALRAAGARAHRGSLDDPDSLRGGAAEADGVIHLAFVHDFGNFEAANATDRRAIAALGEALAGSGRPFVVTSGTGLLPPGRVGTEEDEPGTHSPRGAAEEVALSFVPRGVRVSVLRLPLVHGEGDHGFVAAAIGIAREKGVAAYPGDGSNRWAGAHVLDVARLYRLALEQAPAGTRLHAVAEEGVPVRQLAEVMGRHLGVPVAAVPMAEAGGHFGWLGAFITLDLPASSVLTRKLLDWRPEGPGLVADLDAGHYFQL
ncbi:SDR family oxidoreductase [Nonomuraea gerenzanensis]|uniref:Putative oxidoreductase n=1 Tax=Nonomuraea gerenzanensis TaxID=93944 RepID=A0A1M4E4B9_9ACTN|nr:SDR family oxidoreductase [Nonomuraea gerenzanensis]UBU15884.1 SDR family oxidoreductase [Nonomuraea gerenzanensis]SBO93677.1 putative oxidoreductase [Nonomuraea gerenzanensis]